MSALEYLTGNSLISHPFKVCRNWAAPEENRIAADWFYDILFVSFKDTIRSVFISSIAKSVYGDVSLTFSNVETGLVIAEVHIADYDVADHYKNLSHSFAAAANEYFAVKLLFGSGLVTKNSFSQSYTADEAELLPSVIVLNAPKLEKFTAETYDGYISDTPTEVHSFTYPAVPALKLRYNSTFVLESASGVGLVAQRGLGAGLYDACPTGDINEVFSLNKVNPDARGALFLNMSSCYTAETLTENSAILFGAYSVGGYLQRYRTFEVYDLANEKLQFDAVHPEHSIVFQNFCKPKCPPESLTAFAYYLNRVTDGAAELDKIIASNVETRGKGEAATDDPTLFVAGSFCDDSDTTFSRCSDPAKPEAYIACGTKFIKYFHEGRTLQLHYDNITTRDYTIVEVVDDNTVRLDNPPTQTTQLSFRVLDNGVFSNMNCAASDYNIGAATFRAPYFKVKYTTSESFNGSGEYMTYLAVVVSVFNPSVENVTIHANFTHSTELTSQSGFKIRTANDVQFTSTANFTIGCREYAFIETVYSMHCDVSGGALDIEVFKSVEGQLVQLGNTYNLRNIKGAECPGTVAGVSKVTRVLQSSWSTYDDTLSLSSGVTESVLYGTAPPWFTFSPLYAAHIAALHVLFAPTDRLSKRYSLYTRSYGGAIAGVVSQLTIDYVADPEIIAPLASRYTESAPLAIRKASIYTVDSPALQILSTNMSILSGDFPSDLNNFKYSCTNLPDGLTLEESSGKVTGQLASTVAKGSTYEITVSASNPSGNAINPQTINLVIPYDAVPEVDFSSTTPGSTFTTDNTTTYSDGTPLIAFTASNPPIYRYALQGILPLGLSLDAISGKITGKVTALATSTDQLTITATNYYGESTPLDFTLVVAKIYSKPSIISPAPQHYFEASISAQSSLEEPLFVVQATQAEGELSIYSDCDTNTLRNRYSAPNLPPGYTLEACTGEVYGSISEDSLPVAVLSGASYSRTYPVRIYATNSAGENYVDVYIHVYSEGVPIINDAAPTRAITVERKYVYTAASPLYTIPALNAPTSYAVVGLPEGLYCNASGQIVGSVDQNLQAADYTVTLTASNAFGTSEPYFKSFRVLINLYLDNPPQNNTYNVTLGTTYAELVTFICQGVANSVEAVTIDSVSTLPTGLSFNPPYISGTVSSLASAGTYVIRVTATTSSYGKSSLDFTIYAQPVTYNTYGNVRNTADEPIEGAVISYGQAVQVSSAINGSYALSGLLTGSYNLSASKQGYLFIPSYRAITVSNSDNYNVNFIGEGPLRLVQGVVTYNGGSLKNITLRDNTGRYTTTTDSYGTYNLYVSNADSVSVFPVSPTYAFAPNLINIVPGETAIIDANFTAAVASLASAPTIISVDTLTTSLLVNFVEPDSSGGVEITNYQYSLNSGATWEALYPASVVNPLHIQGLISGTQYRIKLRAVNIAGPGVPSNTVYATPVGVPDAPVITEIVNGAAQLQVLFTPGSSNGANITNYSYSLDGGNTWADRSPESALSPITIVGLANGTPYDVAIRAINIAGAGATSDIVAGTPATSPTVPTITQILAQNTALVVYFTPPTNNGGLEITNYLYSSNNGVSYTTPNPPNLTSPVTIYGLTNGVNYDVVIAALNASGVTPSTKYVGTPATTPGAPTVTGIAVGIAQLLVSFQAPANNGTAITDYKYSIITDTDYLAGTQHTLFVSVGSLTSPITVTGLTDGVKYHIAIRAVNAMGDGDISLDQVGTPGVPPAPATAPLNLSAPQEQINDLNVYFDPPADTGNSPILYYQYNLNNTAIWNTPYPAVTSSPMTIYDLVKARLYNVKIRAVNLGGAGAASNVIAASVVGPPDPPTNLRVTAGYLQLTVAFSAPVNNGGGSVTNYEYAINAPDFDLFNSLNTTTSPVTITGLTNGTQYSLVLRAVSVYGPGSSSVVATGTPASLPAPPTGLSIQAGNGTLTLQFLPGYDGGSAVTNYLYSTNAGVTYRSANSGVSPIVLNNLTNNVTYSVILKSVNSVGTSATASVSVSGTPIGSSTPPVLSSSVTSPTGGSLSVGFTAPANNGGYPITNYSYSINGGAFVVVSPAQTASPLVIAGLTNNATYSIRLKAINSGGFTSAQSNAVTGKPLPTVCSAPRNLTAVPGNHQLTLNFSPPEILGGDTEVRYYEYSIDSGSYISTNSAATSFTIYGLTNGTLYTINVRAVNTATATPPSASITAKSYTVPDAPLNLSVQVPYGDTIPRIYFTPPFDGGSAINDYQYSINGGVFVSVGNTVPFDLVRLDRQVQYTVAVKAVNIAGGGQPAMVSITPLTLPEAPTLNSLSPSLTALTLNFTPPNAPVYVGGSLPILNYRYSIDGGGSFMSFSPAVTTSPLTITSGLMAGVNTSLVTGTPYSVALQAITADGYGGTSNIITRAPGI